MKYDRFLYIIVSCISSRNKVYVYGDMISHLHVYRLPSQKKCSYRHHIDSGIEADGKAIPKYKGNKKG